MYSHQYRPLESPANWARFRVARENSILMEPDLESGAFLVLHTAHELHECVDLPAQSLRTSWLETNEYFDANDRTQRPPLACHPLYVIAVGDDECERIAYVGKTTSKVPRFSAGHRAVTQLHHPKFAGLSKRLYRCCLVFISKHAGEVPVEWVSPYERASQLLARTEAMLVYHFQPELNTQLKSVPQKFQLSSIHIQNVCGRTSFLHDEFVFQPAPAPVPAVRTKTKSARTLSSALPLKDESARAA